jgi:hypothetical protein
MRKFVLSPKKPARDVDTMKKIDIFDPAMCCSTGLCGPSIDPELLRVAAVINAMQEKGVKIERHNPTSEPKAFVDNSAIASVLAKDGVDILPVTLVDGEIVKKGGYPTNEEFSLWTGLSLSEKGQSNESCCCCSDDCC